MHRIEARADMSSLQMETAAAAAHVCGSTSTVADVKLNLRLHMTATCRVDVCAVCMLHTSVMGAIWCEI